MFTELHLLWRLKHGKICPDLFNFVTLKGLCHMMDKEEAHVSLNMSLSRNNLSELTK